MVSQHIPVLLKEAIHFLNPQPNQNFIDCTIGGAGHAVEILKRTGPEGKLLGLEVDPDTLHTAKARLASLKQRATLVLENFKNLSTVIAQQSFPKVHGILFDLGMSSMTLEHSGRGFSFLRDEPLDMRLDPKQDLTASQIVNSYSEDELAEIFRKYGEEPQAWKIAQEIVAWRKLAPIKTSQDLARLIQKIKKSKTQPKAHEATRQQKHPATRVFQALRIAVNDELSNLEKALPQALTALAAGGRIVVISFHSLEDRIVKNFFRREARGCLCPPGLPECRCQHQKQINLLTKKPVRPSALEIKNNPRARSALLRAAQRIGS